MRNTTIFNLIITLTVVQFFGCNDQKEIGSTFQPPSPKYLYVASGACYAGGISVTNGSGVIARFRINSGQLDKILVDYNSLAPGDMPVAMVEIDNNHFFVVTENSSGRRIDIVNKINNNVNVWYTNGTVLNSTIRSAALMVDGSLLVSKSTSVERFSTAKSRVTIGASPYINNPGSTCSGSSTLLSSVLVLPNQNILLAHAGASPNNRLLSIAKTGYQSTSDCLSVKPAPSTLALPTAMAYLLESQKLLVAYGSTNTAHNYIYSYDVNLDTNAISGDQKVYENTAFVLGPSAIAVNQETKEVFIANGGSSFYNVFRFQWNQETNKLDLVSSQPFLTPSIFTRCISSMFVGE